LNNLEGLTAQNTTEIVVAGSDSLGKFSACMNPVWKLFNRPITITRLTENS